MQMKQNNPYKAQKAGKRFYPAMLLLVLLLVSCSQDEAPTAGYGASGKQTSLQVASLATGNGATTRATTLYSKTDSIGFFVKANGSYYVARSNIKGIYDDEKYHLWLPVDSIWLNNYTATLAVYAPYDAVHGTDGTLKLAACIRPADGSKDISYKTFTAYNRSTPPSLTLTHVYSRLTVNITRAAEYTKEVTLNSVGMKGSEIYKEASFRPFDNAKDYGTDKEFTLPINPAVVVSDADRTQTIDLLLIPASLTGDVTLYLDGPGEKFKVTIARGNFGNALTAGKQYKINLTLKGTVLVVTSVTITDWEIEKIDDEKDAGFK